MRATKQPCECGRYTISEAARLLGVGPATLRRWLEVGERTVDAGGGAAL